MLFYDEVVTALKQIGLAGDIKSRIVTNAFWATDRLVGVSRLTVLKEAGLTELNYSVDDFLYSFAFLDQ
jgi:hypothetical protein